MLSKQEKDALIKKFRNHKDDTGSPEVQIAILSREMNVPVVPVVLQGAYEAMPVGKKMPRFRQDITVTFLPPISPENLEYGALTEKVQHVIQRELEE